MSEGKSNTKNCLIYGCATMFVMFIVGVAVIFFGARWGYKKLVNTYTSATANQLPAVTYTDAEVQSLTNRLDNFKIAANALTNEVTLKLNARDINVLIHSQDELKNMRDKFHIEIGKDTITSAVAVPLDGFGLDALKGRFLNGKAGLKVSIVDGKIDVRLDSLEMNGTPASPSFITQLKNENLAKDIKLDPQEEKILQRVEKLTIENGEVILKLKAATEEKSVPATTNAVPADVI
ncbi:MAG TPA: hypothetical protein VGH19_03675 [Verrucomicrobiae bacterium]